MTGQQSFDYIVVGAGAAGGVLAARLAEAGQRVLSGGRRRPLEAARRSAASPAVTVGLQRPRVSSVRVRKSHAAMGFLGVPLREHRTTEERLALP